MSFCQDRTHLLQYLDPVPLYWLSPMLCYKKNTKINILPSTLIKCHFFSYSNAPWWHCQLAFCHSFVLSNNQFLPFNFMFCQTMSDFSIFQKLHWTISGSIITSFCFKNGQMYQNKCFIYVHLLPWVYVFFIYHKF